MEMIIDFPGGKKVDAHLGAMTVETNQDGSAPSPFGLFLASIGTCAGIYVLSFCQQRNLPTENVRVVQHIKSNPLNGMVSKIDLEIQVPSDFPEQYKKALIKSANMCAVKKHLENPPEFNTYTQVV
ncbi:MAG: OsmC family protein [Anaerolineaceae bacterium]|nr:OsmC family protein [Anaerolineaceae bacterium]